MAKRILAAVMLVLVLVSCVAITATATTKTIKATGGTCDLYTVGKWEYKCSIWSGKYISNYIDDNSGFHYYHCFGYNAYDHASWVKNNKTGATSGWVYAKCGTWSKAQVKASWTGSGSASWYLQ